MIDRRALFALPMGVRWAVFKAHCPTALALVKGNDFIEHTMTWAAPSWLMASCTHELIETFYFKADQWKVGIEGGDKLLSRLSDPTFSGWNPA
jgi:hypothetical protein